MFDLDLSRCPICQTQRRLIRQAREVQGQHFIWYECPECGSALMWMGGDRWIYQKVGRPDRQYLAKRPLTTVELQAMSAASAPAASASTYVREEPPAKAEPDWYRQEPPAKAEPDRYRQEPPAAATNIRDQLPPQDLYTYEPEPVAPIQEFAPLPAEAEKAAVARPKGIPKSLVIAVAVIALLCVIAAVLIFLTQG